MGKCLSSIGKWALRRSNFPYWRGTPKVNVTATRPPMSVSASGTNLVSHAGSRLLAEVADRTGLTAALSEALAGRTAPQTAHDPGRVLVDLAVMIADGGTTISDIAALGHQQAVFGPVASDSTCWRVLDAITESDLVALGAARARAREVAWLGRAELTGTALPPIRVAGVDLRDRTGRAVLVIDLDATIVIAHSEKEQARPTFKGSFGYHPLLAFCDNTHEALAGLLRPGNAGSNTATDHLQVLDAALAQIPQQFRHGHPILIRADGAGSTRALLEHITGLGKSLIAAEFSVGWAITERERTAIKALPARFWTPAIDSSGDLRDGADVAELTGLLPAALLATYPAGMRVIVRRERPHPGARYHHRPRAARLARRQAPQPRPRRRPDPVRERHRHQTLPLPRVRDQPGLAALRAHRHRPPRLDPDHPPARPPHPRGRRAQDAALPAAPRRRPAHPQRPLHTPAHRPNLAMGGRPGHRLPPAPITTAARLLTLPTSTY
jgi:hypothetical protein